MPRKAHRIARNAGKAGRATTLRCFCHIACRGVEGWLIEFVRVDGKAKAPSPVSACAGGAAGRG
jgi:hypothetical protein